MMLVADATAGSQVIVAICAQPQGYYSELGECHSLKWLQFNLLL